VAHCSNKNLADLKTCLAAIRRWPGIVEPKPGIFYFGRTAFLHFHLKDGVRSADVRTGRVWAKPVEIPIGARAAPKKRFVSEVKRRYEITAAVYNKPRKQ